MAIFNNSGSVAEFANTAAGTGGGGGFLGNIFNMLGGAFKDTNINQWGSLAGQLSQIDPTQPIGGQLGAIGTGMNQTQIMDAQREELIKRLQGLTGEGVNTESVKIGPDGELKVSGTAAKTEQVPLVPTQEELKSEMPSSIFAPGQRSIYDLLGGK